MTIRRMRITCWIPKATNTHTDCVILIACPRQQWLGERASVLKFIHLLPVLFMCTAVSLIQCVRKVTVHLQKVLGVMFTSVCTGLNPFNFIRKHFLKIFVRKVAVRL
jgi:hypothetical protein